MSTDSGNPFDAARVAYEAGQRDGFQAGREQMMGGIEQVSYDKGQRDMLAKCIAELEALMAKTDGDRFHGFWDAIAALRALQEKPTPPPLPPSVGVPEKRWFT